MKLPYTYKETSDFEKGFAEYYEKHILPLKDQLEPQRSSVESKEPRNKFFAITLSIFSFIGVMFTGKFYALTGGKAFGKLIVGVCVGIWWLFVGRHRTKYFYAAKEQIVPLLLKFIGDFSYEPKGKIDDEIIKSHLIFPNGFHNKNSEDCIKGVYKGVNIQISEISIHKYDNAYLFKGLLIFLENVSTLEGSIIIKPCDSFFSSSEEGSMKKKANLIPYKTESEQFDFEFKIYASSQEIAQKLLTPTFQSKLLGLNMIFSGSGLRCSYINKNILIAVPSTENLFETGTIDIPSINADNIKRMLNEIKAVLGIVDSLLSIQKMLVKYIRISKY